jgi:hypothetical protein
VEGRELDYTEQSSWLLFLKYIDTLEQEKSIEAELEGKRYEFLLESRFWWSEWAVPRNDDGSIDHDNTLIGDDLRDFVNRELFPYLEGFKQRASGPDTIAYKIGEIFGEIRNKIQSGYNRSAELTAEDCATSSRVWTSSASAEYVAWYLRKETSPPVSNMAMESGEDSH